MSELPPARSENATPRAVAPVVISQGVSYRDLQRAILFAFTLYLMYQAAGPIGTLLLLFLLVFILAAVLNPVVVWLNRRGWPRIIGAITVIGAIITIVAVVGSLAVPPLLNELGSFFGNLDQKEQRLIQYYNDLSARYPQLAEQLPPPSEIIQFLTPRVTSLLGQLGRYTINLLVGLVSLVIMLVLVLFTLAHPTPLVTGLLSAAPERYRDRTATTLRRILEQLKNWAAGSLILGIIIGVMTGVGLWSLGKLTGHPVPYILLFSVIAGLGELIPNIGPVLSAVPPAIVALTIDPMLALWVIVLFVLIQQLENNLVVPVVMGQSLNLHPLSVTFTVLVMGALFGLLGAILAVPVCAIIKVFWEEWYLVPQNTNSQALEAIAEEIISSATAPPKRSVTGGDSIDTGAEAATTD